MPKLKFYDLKRRKSFVTDKYKLVTKRTRSGMRKFAVAKAPSGVDSYRIVSMKFKG